MKGIRDGLQLVFADFTNFVANLRIRRLFFNNLIKKGFPDKVF